MDRREFFKKIIGEACYRTYRQRNYHREYIKPSKDFRGHRKEWWI